MAYRMTRGARRMSARMKPLHGGTILSSTHGTTPIEIDSDTDHDQTTRKSAGSSTRESKLSHAGPQCLLFMVVGRSNHPHLPRDNEEVNVHVKRLQAMLDMATVVDLVYD
jgi:hypothetical protein